MNNFIVTDIRMYHIMITLGFIIMLSLVGTVIRVVVLNQPVPERLITLGIIATTGLVRFLIPILLIR